MISRAGGLQIVRFQDSATALGNMAAPRRGVSEREAALVVRGRYMWSLRASRLAQTHFGLAVGGDVSAGLVSLLLAINALLGAATARRQQVAAPGLGPLLAESAAAAAHALLRVALLVEACAAAAAAAEHVRWRLAAWSLRVPPLHFSAAGFFAVDRSLLVSIMSIMVTYGVVLYQFHSM